MKRDPVIYDRLYGRIPYSEDDVRLFQTKELTRLRQVSLSAVPPWIIPTGVCASRFEHSVGVGHLARVIGRKSEFRDIAHDLFFAALAHDIGSPPFSHLSEHFQRRIIGKNHEQFVEDVVADSEFAREVQRQGGSLSTVVQLVKGEITPWSDLINGSLDIDNLDNTLRYGVSMGILSPDSSPYSPVCCAKGFLHRDGKLFLDADLIYELRRWQCCRQTVYGYVLSPANLSPGMMLYRALSFAEREGEIPRHFFFLTDAEAFRYLLERCNPRTRVLTERAQRWCFYECVASFSTATPSPKFQAFAESIESRIVLADRVSALHGIPPEDVCAYAGKSRGPRSIHLPFWEDAYGAIPSGLAPKEPQPMWIVQVFLHPVYAALKEVIGASVKRELEIQF